jgi:aryl carrier-like protein
MLEAFDQQRDIAYPGLMSVRLAPWLPRVRSRGLVVRIAGMEMAKMGLDDSV